MVLAGLFALGAVVATAEGGRSEANEMSVGM